MKTGHILAIALLSTLTTACENREYLERNTQPQGPDNHLSPIERATPARPSFMSNTVFELGGQCNMETINWRPWNIAIRVDRTIPILHIAGWAADAAAKKAPTSTYLRMQDQNGKEYYAKTEQTGRKDVAAHFREKFYEKSGYKIRVDVQDLPDGIYDVVIVMESDGKSLLCSSGQKMTLESKG